MPTRRLLYVEFDGQVYLVRRGDTWTFPDASQQLPFAYEVRHETTIEGVRVAFCRPDLASFPDEWMFKDEVPLRRDVDPIVQRAINASLARCVVGLLVEDRAGNVLMVQSSRGFTKGMWNVPGGFIEYGEAPEHAAVREAKEETGLDVELGEFIGVYTERFESPYFMYGFMYAARADPATLRLDPTEIAAAQWMSPARALRETRNPFAQKALARRFRLSFPPAARPHSPRAASA